MNCTSNPTGSINGIEDWFTTKDEALAYLSVADKTKSFYLIVVEDDDEVEEAWIVREVMNNYDFLREGESLVTTYMCAL